MIKVASSCSSRAFLLNLEPYFKPDLNGLESRAFEVHNGTDYITSSNRKLKIETLKKERP